MKNNDNINYNPVKETVGGKEAEKVVWSTKSIEMAVDGIKKGLPLKANPFCGKNTKLLKPDLVYKRTKEEIDDYIHCMQDPVYFASKCYLMTPTGLKPCVLRDYQIDYLNHLKNHRFSIFLSCRQSGKSFLQISTIEIKITNSFIDSYKKNFPTKINKIFYILEKYSKNDTNDILELPVFELYNLFNDSVIWKLKYRIYQLIYKAKKIKKSKILYKILNILDYIDFHFIKKEKLLDNYKTTEEIDISEYDIQIKTDTGYKPLTNLMQTKPFEQYIITLSNGYSLNCADEHIVFDKDFNEIYVKDLRIGDNIQTDKGLSKVVKIEYDSTKISMCDTTVGDENHRFYSNGILSHNSTTTAIYCLWTILFNTDKSGLILSKSGPAGQDLLAKIKDMFLFLPYHLKCGVMKWNQSSISFDNNSKIETEAFSDTAGLGKTINFLILDEFAWCPPNEVELFYNNIIPTISADTTANICIMSTQNGFNLFYRLYTAAVKGDNIYAPFKVDWYQVPMWDAEHKKWVKRDEKWKQEMIGILGSEEAFYYQYGTQFSISDACLVSRECMAKLHHTEVVFKSLTDDDNKLLHKMEDAGIYIALQHLNCLYFNPNFDFEELRTKHFIILCDLAEGGGGDYTVFNIFRVDGKEEYSQIGYWTSNRVDLEHAALEFWLMCCELFNDGRTLVSIEWNTYGALFYNYIKNYNEPDYDEDSIFRFNMAHTEDGFDMYNIIQYKKDSIEASAMGKHTSNYMPGIKFSSGNKHVACSMLRMKLEKEKIHIYDVGTINELENFEDKNGNGSYAAKTGHDDLIMTVCQIPMLEQTPKFKEFMEDLETENIQQNMNSKWNDNGEQIDMYGGLNNSYHNMFAHPSQMLGTNLPNNFNMNNYNNSNRFNTYPLL